MLRASTDLLISTRKKEDVISLPGADKVWPFRKVMEESANPRSSICLWLGARSRPQSGAHSAGVAWLQSDHGAEPASNLQLLLDGEQKKNARMFLDTATN